MTRKQLSDTPKTPRSGVRHGAKGTASSRTKQSVPAAGTRTGAPARGQGEHLLPAKDERLQVRVPAEHIELTRRAAALEGTTVSDFARRAVEQRAHDTLERHRSGPTRITLDPAAFDAFLAACDAPAPPNETLRETIRASLAFDVE